MRAIVAPAIQKVEVVVRRHSRIRAAGGAGGKPLDPGDVLASFVGPYGLYLHVPFCKSICPYCPYNKVLYRAEAVPRYFGALRQELELYDAPRRRFTSLYVGGGTPSLCLRELATVLEGVTVERERAIEVMPNHATSETVAELHALGFDYVSLGIQSFDPTMLRHLGRLNTAADNRRALEATVGGFGCVNADLIFDIAFVEPDVFLRDLETCCRSGVDQISTYPLMHFGFTPFGTAAHDPGREHELLRRACELADSLGYERRAVWTFTRRGGPLYASIARELYLGCGAGAATFTGTDFLVNHFGLGPYEVALAEARLPIARRAHLDPRRAALYYAFWQLYAPGIDLDRFQRLFPGAPWVIPFLQVLRRTGHLEPVDGRLRLTERGFDRYHDLERWVTYHLIEPLWEDMLQEHPVRDRPRPRVTAERSRRRVGGRVTGAGLRRPYEPGPRDTASAHRRPVESHSSCAPRTLSQTRARSSRGRSA
jgi:oxygen-independent coproporphyrinogen-3 oxidase